MSRSFAVFLGAIAVSACASSSPAHQDGHPARSPQSSPAATYELVEIGGHSLPYAPRDPHAPADAPPGPEVVRAILVILEDGTFRHRLTFRLPGADADTIDRELTGTWVPEAPGYRLRWEGAGTTPATLKSDLFTIDNAGLLFSFRRQR
ncbi:MAG: hypothetical protein WEB88_11945 [Gemmatimonadota bacterium]